MPKGKRAIKIVLVAGVIIIALSLGLIFAPRGPALPELSSDFLYEKIDPPRQAPDFSLSDQFGETVRLSDYQDGTVILAFWYSKCTHSCEVNAFTLARLHALIRQRIPEVANDMKFLAVTLDPEWDTQEQRRWFVETYIEQFGGNLSFLGGDPGEVTPLWKEYDVFVEHTTISEYLERYNLTEEELLESVIEDLEIQPHADLPEGIKEGILNSIHVAIAEDHLVIHEDAIYIIKGGTLRFEILGHDIDVEKFLDLISYVASQN